MKELLIETITSLTSPWSILNNFAFSEFGRKEISRREELDGRALWRYCSLQEHDDHSKKVKTFASLREKRKKFDKFYNILKRRVNTVEGLTVSLLCLAHLNFQHGYFLAVFFP